MCDGRARPLTPDAFLELLGEHRASAILRTPIAEAAAPAMEAAVRAGFRIVEFTLSIPEALERIAEFAPREGLTVGAGTVLTAEDARAAVAAGARFLVSPVVDEEVIDEAAHLGVAMIPGTQTPTEMLRAHRAGAPLQKVFPEIAGGPAAIAAVLGPLPFLRLVPTAGVGEDNAADYLRAGAYAVGFVGSLFPSTDVERGRIDRIEERARRMLSAVRRGRG